MDNDFYYKLLNIRQQNLNISKIIEENIQKVVNPIKKTNNDLERLCKVISNNLYIELKDKGLNVQIINLGDFNLYEHIFLLIREIKPDNINYYLVDPTFIQFKDKYPYNNLKDNNSDLLNNLMIKGYKQIDNFELEDFINSFSDSYINIDIDDLYNRVYKNKPTRK